MKWLPGMHIHQELVMGIPAAGRAFVRFEVSMNSSFAYSLKQAAHSVDRVAIVLFTVRVSSPCTCCFFSDQ